MRLSLRCRLSSRPTRPLPSLVNDYAGRAPMKPSAATRFSRRFIAALAACLFFWASIAYSTDGPQIHLPNAAAKLKSGWIVDVDGRGIDANGYRPVRVTISTLRGKPVTADHQVRVVVGCQGEDYRSHVTRVSQVIEIPEGSTSASATLLVPQGGPFTGISIDTYEGGEKLLDLCQDAIGWPSNNNWNWNWTEARPALLFIDSNAPSRGEQFALVQAYQSSATDSMSYTLPDVRQLLNLFPESNNNQRWMPRGAAQPKPPIPQTPKITDAALLTLLAARSRVGMVPPSDLPSRWIELSQFDVAVLSLADLKKMAQSQTKQVAALRDWLSTGALLIVSGCGDNFGELQALEKLLELPQLDSIDDKHAELLGWTPPALKDRIGNVKIPFDENGDVVGSFPVENQPLDSDTRKPADAAEVKYPTPFVFRRAKLGCVVAIAANQPFPGSRSDWSWIFNTAGESHWQWFKRNGCSMHRPNGDFWKLLIPGVGRAPVWSYLLLVSLFAVVIGPLNYLLLDRARRLYLLLITVPVGALVVTTSLFAFAMLSDGVGTRLRVRSFTDLDQTTGRAAVYSRQSYYAAIAPSQGLHFPDDTTVFGMRQDPGDRSSQRSTLLVWDGNQQLRGAYLTSRTATQFMVCRATTTPARLIVTEGAAAGSPPKIENQLATKINYLLIRDSRGDYFAASSIQDKASATLENVELLDAEKAIDAIAKPVDPKLPDGYETTDANKNFFNIFGINRYRPAYSDAGAGDPLMAKSLLEANIKTSLMPTVTPPPPGSYIAIVEMSPLVITGVGPLKEEASFHVIRGRYQDAKK